jgi:hypothetical protein
MQELTDSIKRPNLRITGNEEGEEVQTKGTHNIFNKIITENLPKLEKVLPIQVQEASRTPNRLGQNRTCPWHIIIKKTSIENRERILKAVREKAQITKKGKPIKFTADFSTETLKARTARSEVFWALNDSKTIIQNRAIKIFHNKQKLKQYMTTKPPLQKSLQGILHTEDESKQNHERMGSMKPQEKKRQGIRE